MTPVLLLALPAYFLQTVLHEGAHALAVLYRGGRVVWFHPWPAIEDGRFVWGGTAWSGRVKLERDWLIPAAPRLVNLAQLAVLAPLRPASHWGQLLVTLALLAAAVDFGVNTAGIFRERHVCDAWQTYDALPWRVSIRVWHGISGAAIGAVLGVASAVLGRTIG